jgi:hypothetical protein
MANKTATPENEFKVTSALQAIDIIESDENATNEQELKAWAFLIGSGMVWQLQGFYGRGARNLIDNGIIDEHGNIL